MLLSPHAVTGAAIATLVPRPTVALPAAVASHYLLDTVPHWQETLPPYTPHAGTWIRLPLDLGMALGLTALIARSRPERAGVIWATAAAAMLPDTDSALSVVPGLSHSAALHRYGRWHAGIQRETASPWGLLPQIGLILACLALVRRWRR